MPPPGDPAQSDAGDPEPTARASAGIYDEPPFVVPPSVKSPVPPSAIPALRPRPAVLALSALAIALSSGIVGYVLAPDSRSVLASNADAPDGTSSTETAAGAATPRVEADPAADAAMPPAASDADDSVRASGRLVDITTLPNEPGFTLSCDNAGFAIEIKNAGGDIVGLADLGQPVMSNQSSDQYSQGYTCTTTWTADVPTDSPVYTFRAYHQGVDTIKPDVRTLTIAEIRAGKPLQQVLTFCPTCRS